MYNYRLLIQYDGGRYKGWQRLGHTDNTIQGKLEAVLSSLFHESVELIGSSRTDAGVHAMGQVANVKTHQAFHVADIKRHLNHYLPQDIAVVEVTSVPESFHARFQTKQKTYLYRIWNHDHPHPFMRKYSLQVREPLDRSKMELASAHFLGSHDFTAFSNAKSKKKSMVREISAITFEEQDGFLLIYVTGNGFLHNMVRKMVGTLLAVGTGDLEPSAISDILQCRERNQVSQLAEASGLFLHHIEYE